MISFVSKQFSIELFSPYETIFSFAAFEPFKDPRVDTLAPKLLFIALNLAAMGLGVWKVSYITCLVMHNYLVFLEAFEVLI